jgi:hypothetical protein
LLPDRYSVVDDAVADRVPRIHGCLVNFLATVLECSSAVQANDKVFDETARERVRQHRGRRDSNDWPHRSPARPGQYRFLKKKYLARL